MNKTIKGIAKSAGMSVFTGVLYGIISYFLNGMIDIQTVVSTMIILFIIWTVAPYLKELLGYSDKK